MRYGKTISLRRSLCSALYKLNVVSPSNSELYHGDSSTSGDDASAHDSLNRLQAYSRGTLSASSSNGGVLDTISSPTDSQTWTLDPLGNWTADTGGNGSETRDFNADNEITSVSGNDSYSPTYDNNGNTTEEPGSMGVVVYDAWNRLVAITQSGIALETRTYYADREMGAAPTPAGARPRILTTRWIGRP